ncbi:gluconate 2-dehydrogenase subunit 3 family protein [Thalassotalea sp. PLHSN55]|uniref:gluconate 2-dehydrogenase subunit 3 family protein n=1 Tax=Thalassotalea sp. PLHSN55 TaxID=3435888 RepID=UPI003F863E56
MSKNISRRNFLKKASLWGTGIIVSTQLPRPLAMAAAAASSKPEILTAMEWQTLEAMTACIIPTDHQPGAKEANCVNFIDKALANEDAAAIPLYKSGLASANLEAKHRFNKRFEQLNLEQQNSLLSLLEKGETKAWPSEAVPVQMFFETMRVHTVIAFLAAPKYGGNQNFAGWQVVGYPGNEHHMGGYREGQISGKDAIIPIWERTGGSGGHHH